MIGIGLVGYGYWGPIIARNFEELDNAHLVAICDCNEERLSLACANHQNIRCVASLEELLEASDIDAVVIATPAASHFSLAHTCLSVGKHVLVEKPLATSSSQVHALVTTASKNQCVLMVDHTYLFSNAVHAIASTINHGELGQIYYYDSIRTNLGRFRSDVDVLWDLASHDLAIIDYLFDETPTSVHATGFLHAPEDRCSLAYLILRWGNSRIAQINVSWIAPVKVRRTIIGGSKGMMVYDDLDPDAKLRIYDHSFIEVNHSGTQLDDPLQRRIGYRAGEMRVPLIKTTEPLHGLAEHFVSCIATGCPPRSDGVSGLRVVSWLEAAQRSLMLGGIPVALVEDKVNPIALFGH